MIYAYIFIRNALSFLNKSIDYKNRINPSQLNLFCFLFEIAIKRRFHFIKSKIKRLLVPFFAAGFFFMLPIKFLGNFYTFNGMIQAILSYWRGGLDADDGHLWFLAALFWCLIIFGTLIQLLKKVHIENVFIPFIICFIIATLASKYPITDFMEINNGLKFIHWLAAGYVFEKSRRFYKF